MHYVNFDVEVGQGAEREYPVTVRSQVGETQVTMRFPFDDLALREANKDLQIALLRSSGVRRQSLAPEARTIQGFGQQLFDALIAGEVRALYDVSRREADQKGMGVRLRLMIQAPELASLPWEYLYDARLGAYTCLSRHTPIVRYLEAAQPIHPLAVTPPLRMLVMIASPSDQDALDIGRERHRLEEALGRLEQQGLLKLRWLEGQTWRDVQRAMQRGPWHIFHFIGHGGFDERRDEGVLALANDEGKTHLLTATQLGTLLADHVSLRLVVLNACEGAKGSSVDLFSSTSATLARRGLPAVLAMQYEISDTAAIEFTRTFYETVAIGKPVDEAASEARKAIGLGNANTLEWGTPVLYLRAPDGKLFDIPEQVEMTYLLSRQPAAPAETPTQPPPQPLAPQPPPLTSASPPNLLSNQPATRPPAPHVAPQTPPLAGVPAPQVWPPAQPVNPALLPPQRYPTGTTGPAPQQPVPLPVVTDQRQHQSIAPSPITFPAGVPGNPPSSTPSLPGWVKQRPLALLGGLMAGALVVGVLITALVVLGGHTGPTTASAPGATTTAASSTPILTSTAAPSTPTPISTSSPSTPVPTSTSAPPPAAGTVTGEFPTPTPGRSEELTRGPDGNFWFTESNANKIGRITPSGAITEFATPTPNSGPLGITSGPDGNLWFAESNMSRIGRITPDGAITEFATPTPNSEPTGITSGPDGNLWFTEGRASMIGRITPGGTIMEFPITAGSAPSRIVSGPDGNLWFTEYLGNQIGRITTGGALTEFSVPTANSQPDKLTSGPDGNLWFVEAASSKIGRITTGGAITEFPLPTSGSRPAGITSGPDGNLWFTEYVGNQIGRITLSGTITEFPIPTANSGPIGIASGTNGDLWFTEAVSNQIGHITT